MPLRDVSEQEMTKLANAVKASGLQPADVAKKAKLDRKAFAKYLSGHERPGPTVIKAIANALKIPAWSLEE